MTRGASSLHDSSAKRRPTSPRDMVVSTANAASASPSSASIRTASLAPPRRRVPRWAQRQRAALDADLVDAHHHAADGGILGAFLGRPIAIPGHDEPMTI